MEMSGREICGEFADPEICLKARAT